jgi:hypothetical protein
VRELIESGALASTPATHLAHGPDEVIVDPA